MKRLLIIACLVLGAQFIGVPAAHAIICSLSVSPTSGPSGTTATVTWRVSGQGAVNGIADFGNNDGDQGAGNKTITRSVTTVYTGAPGTIFDLSLDGYDDSSSCHKPTQNNPITFRIGGGPPSGAVCSNNLDDDGDGYTDYPNDCGCTDPSDTTEANTGGCNNVSYSDITIETFPVQSLKWNLVCPGGPYTCNGRQGTGDMTPAQMDAICQNGACAGAGDYYIRSGWGGQNPNPGYDCVGSSDFRPWTRLHEPIYLSLDCVPTVPTPTPTPTPPPLVNNSACVTHTIPGTMTPGQTVAVSVTFQNTGTTTWTQLAPANYDVSLWPWPPINPSLTPQTGDISSPSVAPGQTMVIPFNLTAPAAPGTYSGQYRLLEQGIEWFGAACGPQNIVVAAPPTLTAALQAAPTSGTEPLDVILRATPGGTATGTINYSVWWHCANATTSVATATAACGALPAPAPGACTANATGYKCNAVMTTPLDIPAHTYPVAGAYTPKVIIERSTAPAAEARTNVTVNPRPPQPPPTISSMSIAQPDYCLSGPGATVTWTAQMFALGGSSSRFASKPRFSEQLSASLFLNMDLMDAIGKFRDAFHIPKATAAAPMFQVQVATDPAFAAIVYDSNPVSIQNVPVPPPDPLTVSGGATIPPNVLRFNTTYHLRLRVTDSRGNASAWSAVSFATPSHAYPRVSFVANPAAPTAGQPTQFTDTTTYGGCDAQSSCLPATGAAQEWLFSDGGAANGASVTYTFANPGAGWAQLTAHDTSGYACTRQVPFAIDKKVPFWREIIPGL